MALTYKRCLELWDKRRGKDWKRVERDLKMRQQPDGVFHLTMNGYRHDGTKWTKGDWPFCTVDQNDIVTILLDHRCNQTEALRVGAVIGCGVGLDASTHRNYESSVRVYCGQTWRDSKPLPYTPGSQFKVYEDEKSNPDYLNPPPDRKIVKDKQASLDIKREIETIRKLIKGMARMGSFEHIDRMLLESNRWQIKPIGRVEDVNVAEPTGRDAEILYTLGATSTTFDRQVWDVTSKTWQTYSDDTLLGMIRQRAASNGIERLREYLYEQRDGFVKVPAKTS